MDALLEQLWLVAGSLGSEKTSVEPTRSPGAQLGTLRFAARPSRWGSSRKSVARGAARDPPCHAICPLAHAEATPARGHRGRAAAEPQIRALPLKLLPWAPQSASLTAVHAAPTQRSFEQQACSCQRPTAKAAVAGNATDGVASATGVTGPPFWRVGAQGRSAGLFGFF